MPPLHRTAGLKDALQIHLRRCGALAFCHCLQERAAAMLQAQCADAAEVVYSTEVANGVECF